MVGHPRGAAAFSTQRWTQGLNPDNKAVLTTCIAAADTFRYTAIKRLTPMVILIIKVCIYAGVCVCASAS